MKSTLKTFLKGKNTLLHGWKLKDSQILYCATECDPDTDDFDDWNIDVLGDGTAITYYLLED
jgi:hypothetical protein